jgi:NitT/TauT family transport system ATP-binding protein
MFVKAARALWGHGGEARAPDGASIAPAVPARLSRVTHRVQSDSGEQVVLLGVDLEVTRGELLVLCGPSGSGKSTVLRMLAGLTAPTEGELVVLGRSRPAPDPQRALVFQDAALFPWLTLRGNVEFPLVVKGLSARARRERSSELLRMVHLGRFADRYPHELSGGMRQRGAIARALATEPSLLLLDEPFSALDPQSARLLMDELEALWQRTGLTMVLVTHDLREAVRLGDRVVVLGTRPGRVALERRVELPRPRALDDERVEAIVRDVSARIEHEVNRTAREEAEEHAQKSTPARGRRSALGALAAQLVGPR